MKARIQYHLNTKVVICSSQKHLGIALGQQLNFNDHIQSKMTTCYKMIGIIKIISKYSSWYALEDL